MQLTVSFELYIDIGMRYIPNMKTYLYHRNQNRNKAENKSVLCIRGIYICLIILDYGALSVFVMNRTCLRKAIPAYCFNIFRSIFGLLLCLLDRKLILASKPI